jgi:DNA-binding GntR family transcriptional regulator
VITRHSFALSELFGEERKPSRGLIRPTSTQQVAVYIRRQVLEGHLKSGERVPQDDIAAELGVSRVPVREAVIALDREGWLVIHPHRGAFVVPLDADVFRDHYELLGRTYGYGALRAAKRGTPEQLIALAAIHKALQAATDPVEFGQLDMDFLQLLVIMSGSRRVAATVRLMTFRLTPGEFFAEAPEAIRLHKRHLKVVMRALKSRDGETAETEIMAMLRKESGMVVMLMAGAGIITGEFLDD